MARQSVVRGWLRERSPALVNETINGLDASVPNGWSSDVPTKGEFTCFYCREQSTVTAFIAQAKEAHPGSIPDDMEWLVKTEWTDAAKCTRIKNKMQDGNEAAKCTRITNKMQEKFATPEVGFTEMDKDGGGTIDRKELAMGLFQMGIWLHPTELKTLFEHVDADEGGSVDLGEFQDFWAKY
ncbi:hypothetical protein T484DRAFT_1822344 [Baffinella frigidus]|nr:hypothetical protein T484DRAFT_1822344 [Cryptophyta sp. CCMP2293]